MTNKRIITIKDVEKEYDLELERVVLDIKKNKVKLVLLQFPDGLKQDAHKIVDTLEREKGVNARRKQVNLLINKVFHIIIF